jgi:hypothetical protein
VPDWGAAALLRVEFAATVDDDAPDDDGHPATLGRERRLFDYRQFDA